MCYFPSDSSEGWTFCHFPSLRFWISTNSTVSSMCCDIGGGYSIYVDEDNGDKEYYKGYYTGNVSLAI